jgi:hypothetical protein
VRHKPGFPQKMRLYDFSLAGCRMPDFIDLKITNQAKNQVIEMMRQERDRMLEQVISANRKVGELESRLLQLEAPKHND